MQGGSVRRLTGREDILGAISTPGFGTVYLLVDVNPNSSVTKESLRKKLHTCHPKDLCQGQNNDNDEHYNEKQIQNLMQCMKKTPKHKDPCSWDTEWSMKDLNCGCSVKTCSQRKTYCMNIASVFPRANEALRRLVSQDTAISNVDIPNCSYMRNFKDIVKRNALRACYKICTKARIQIKHEEDLSYSDCDRYSCKMAVPRAVQINNGLNTCTNGRETDVHHRVNMVPCGGKGRLLFGGVLEPTAIVPFREDAEKVREKRIQDTQKRINDAVFGDAEIVDLSFLDKNSNPCDPPYAPTTCFTSKNDCPISYKDETRVHKQKCGSTIAGTSKKVKYSCEERITRKHHFAHPYLKSELSRCSGRDFFSMDCEEPRIEHYKCVCAFPHLGKDSDTILLPLQEENDNEEE